MGQQEELATMYVATGETGAAQELIWGNYYDLPHRQNEVVARLYADVQGPYRVKGIAPTAITRESAMIPENLVPFEWQAVGFTDKYIVSPTILMRRDACFVFDISLQAATWQTRQTLSAEEEMPITERRELIRKNIERMTSEELIGRGSTETPLAEKPGVGIVAYDDLHAISLFTPNSDTLYCRVDEKYYRPFQRRGYTFSLLADAKKDDPICINRFGKVVGLLMPLK